MNLLAIDTAASICAACVLDTTSGRERGRAVLDLGKGHAEHLMGTIGEALEKESLGYHELGMVAVSVGPGSFTGIRVGVSAARGLALALKIPAVGVTTLEALTSEAADAFPGRDILAVIDAGRSGIYASKQGSDGVELHAPALLSIVEAAEMASGDNPVLTGSGTGAVVAHAGRALTVVSDAATADIATYARLAAARGLPGIPASPLYLRAADAKPQQGFALPRKVDE